MTGGSSVLPAGLGQRIAFGFALLFYLGAILCAVALALWLEPLGGEHPVIASLAASIVFFVGGGIVLHVIGRASLPDLRPGLPVSELVDGGRQPPIAKPVQPDAD